MPFLSAPQNDHMSEMLNWFKSEDEIADWSGVRTSFPEDLETFKELLNLESSNSYVFLSDEYELLGFGQFYPKFGKCHLARLVVNPKFRGKGLISQLIDQLAERGRRELGMTELSLFVYPHNRSAIKSYLKLGFIKSESPENSESEEHLYLVM